jgi:hypothetical protein
MLVMLLCGMPALAMTLILPNLRSSYYAHEAVELAVSGTTAGTPVVVTLQPTAPALQPVELRATGDGATITLTLPPGSLAPDTYTVLLNGVSTKQKLVIASGIADSSMLLSLSGSLRDVQKAQGNFVIGGTVPGNLDPNGMPSREVRRRTPMLSFYDDVVASNRSVINFWYWSGFITHKPWGRSKSWASPSEQQMMRLANFSAGQSLRRFAPAIVAQGCMDEPGLSWGRTPGGGLSTGFPSWDEQPWYEARGWTYTNDPASRDDVDWMRYMTIRNRIILESFLHARNDLRTVWPTVPFSTDAYVSGNVCDGSDAIHQEANGDLPSTHVFPGFTVGHDCASTMMLMEKSVRPTANMAHVMNGQLMRKRVPQPQQTYGYRIMLHSMLQAGLYSNWWLNWGAMKPEEIAVVDEPAKRYGPLLQTMT